MKKLLILTAIIILTALVFLIININTNPEDLSNPSLKFHSGECNESINPYESSNLGIKEIKWINSNGVIIKAVVTINCATDITSGDFEYNETTISLKYNSSSCNPCTTCACAHELIYEISNLPRTDYKFIL